MIKGGAKLSCSDNSFVALFRSITVVQLHMPVVRGELIRVTQSEELELQVGTRSVTPLYDQNN